LNILSKFAGLLPKWRGKNKSTQGKWDLLKDCSHDGTACSAERIVE
jgi:hypothetical protein